MSSYFDEMAARVGVAGMDNVIATENDMIGEVNLVTGDREFPDDLRERIQGIIAVRRIERVGGDRNLGSAEWFDMIGRSRLIDDLHSAFHDVGSRRVETRFGLLTDSPRDILKRRSDHDAPAVTVRP